MCACYELTATPDDLADRFGLTFSSEVAKTGEIRPTNRVPVIIGAEARLQAWGLPSTWGTTPLINARAETLAEKQTFQPLLEQRCIVPANAYFEWRRDGQYKLKTRISGRDTELFSFAGLTNGTAFTIITCAPIQAIAHIHTRMPVVLSPGSESQWLNSSLAFPAVAPLLEPNPALSLTVREMSPKPPQGDLFS